MHIWEWEQDGERPSSSMWAPAALGQVMAVLMGGVKAKLNSRGDCHRDTRWLQPRASAQAGRGSWQSATRASTNSQHPNTHDLDCKAANRLCLLLTPVDCWWLPGRVGTEGRSGSARRDATDRPCHTDSRRGAQPIFEDVFPAGSASRPAEPHPSQGCGSLVCSPQAGGARRRVRALPLRCRLWTVGPAKGGCRRHKGSWAGASRQSFLSALPEGPSRQEKGQKALQQALSGRQTSACPQV